MVFSNIDHIDAYYDLNSSEFVKMSTKIFNGYYIDPCTLQELQEFSMVLRAKIKLKMEELYARKLLKLATYYHDKKYICKSRASLKYTPLCTAAWKIDERFYKIEKTNIRDPAYDFSFDVTFIPTKSRILVLVYTEQRECVELFESLINVHPYPYYDNIDKPDEISDEGWELRGEEWDTALKPYDIPALAGFTVKCFIYTPLFSKKELEVYKKYIPTFQGRVDHFAKLQLWELFFKRYQRHYNCKPKIYECMEWIETRTGIDRLEQLKAKIGTKLKNIPNLRGDEPPNLTIDDLLEEIW